jgi:hypothetical protein
MCDLGAPWRPSPPGASHANGQPVKANMRRITAESGSAFVTTATVALAVQAAGLLYVSFAAQFAYVLREKPGQRAASVIEALMLDTGMVIFSVLALGLAKKGLPPRAERTLIMVCAGLSAAMNYAASDTASWRSVAVYVIAPVFLAVVTDRVIAGVRRHVLGPGGMSAWATLGRALAAAARAAAMVLLYLLRFLVDRRGTCRGLRAWILANTPLPEAGQPPEATRSVTSEPARAGAAGAPEIPGPAVVPRLAATPGSAPQPAGAARNGHAGPSSLEVHHAIPPGRRARNGDRPPAARPAAGGAATDDAIDAHYAAGLDAGQVPSGKAIRRQWHVGSIRADHIHIRLTARYLANLPAGEIPGAVAALSADEIAKVRDILGAPLPGHGTGFGPNAGVACQACTDAPDTRPARPAGNPGRRQEAGAP